MSYSWGHAAIAWLIAILVTYLCFVIALTGVMIVDQAGKGYGVDLREVVSFFMSFLAFWWILAIPFSILPFAAIGASLKLLRVTVAPVFLLAGTIAAYAAGALIVWLLTDREDDPMDELRKLTFEDFAGGAVVVGGALGGLAARGFLRRSGRQGNAGGV